MQKQYKMEQKLLHDSAVRHDMALQTLCQKSILVYFTTPWSQSSKNVFVKGLYCKVPYVVSSATLYYHHNSVEKQREQQEVTDFNSKDLWEQKKRKV